jgi:hypothetical protein
MKFRYTGKKMFYFNKKSEVPPKKSNTIRGQGQDLLIFVNIFEIYLVRQSL